MEKEELEKLREEYVIAIKEREKLKKAKKRIKELEKDPKVREYMGLMGAKDKKILTDEELIKKVYYDVCYSSRRQPPGWLYEENPMEYDTLDTYICCAWSKGHLASAGEEVDAYQYTNILNFKIYIRILPSEKEEFEKNKVIINYNTGETCHNLSSLRDDYFEALILGLNDEEAVNKIHTLIKEGKYSKIDN